MPETTRHWLPALFMLAGAAVVSLVSSRRQEAVGLRAPLAGLPSVIDGSSGRDRAIDSASVRVAGMTDYLYRLYGADSTPAFSVYVGYYDSQRTGHTIHSPRNCLPGAGWEVVESMPVLVGGATVNRYVVANGPQQAVVYYWYQGRGRVAWSEYRVKWDLFRDAAMRGRTEEALVRVVVPVRVPMLTDATSREWRSRMERADAIGVQAVSTLLPAIDGLLPTIDRG